jgi:hypothetical protein
MPPYKKKKVQWAPATGLAEIEPEFKRAFVAPVTHRSGDAEFTNRNAGDLFIVQATSSSTTLRPWAIERSPHRWLIPAYAGFSENVEGSFGIYAGVERTLERKDHDAKNVMSRLRHVVLLNGEKFFVHDDVALKFLSEE